MDVLSRHLVLISSQRPHHVARDDLVAEGCFVAGLPAGMDVLDSRMLCPRVLASQTDSTRRIHNLCMSPAPHHAHGFPHHTVMAIFGGVSSVIGKFLPIETGFVSGRAVWGLLGDSHLPRSMGAENVSSQRLSSAAPATRHREIAAQG